MSDYERIAEAIRFIVSRADEPPTLGELAARLRLSTFHTQRLFSRWAGISPKRFMQYLTVERAKHVLQTPLPVLAVSEELGLSSGSRLYDHFVRVEAVTPGEYKQRGAGMTIEYAMHTTPFGKLCLARTPRGICRLTFLEHADEMAGQLAELRQAWPHATLLENEKGTTEIIDTIFASRKAMNRPLSLYVSGTNFQIQVWKALLRIMYGRLTSYGHIAETLGRAGAARAVGQAVAANPIAFLIPCHRVIRESGALGGYRWGETRKRAMHVWEAARAESFHASTRSHEQSR